MSGEMKKDVIERYIGELDGMIATFGQAVVFGRNQKEAEAGELLKDARLKLIEDMEKRYGQNWQPGWMKIPEVSKQRAAAKGPEVVVWQSTTEMSGTPHERNSHYMTLKDGEKAMSFILRLSADGTMVVEPYQVRDYDYDHDYDEDLDLDDDEI